MELQIPEEFANLPEAVKAHFRPSIRIRTQPADIESLSLGQSRMGGVPDLPAGFEWPRYNGHPLSFVAQLDLSDLAGLPSVLPLPNEGFLVFFYDTKEYAWGFDPKDRGSAAVRYLKEPASSLVRTPPPEDLQEDLPGRCCSLNYEVEVTIPEPRAPCIDGQLSEEVFEQLIDVIFAEDDKSEGVPRHRIGGHPNALQGSMELQCQLASNGVFCGDPSYQEDKRTESLMPGAADWRLLLQVDTDDNANTMWGDCGMLYFWIHERDLRSQNFENSWLILQCF